MEPVTTIVPVGELMNEEAIRMEVWRTGTLSLALGTPRLAVMWLARRRLIRNDVLCLHCLQQCSLITHAASPDGLRWQCRACRRRTSIRHDTFFFRSQFSLRDIITFVFFWCHNIHQRFIALDLDMSRGTVVDWANFCREECTRVLQRAQPQLGGFDEQGEPVVVELDESKYFHRKYHRGQWREGHWVFGGIQRGTKRCFMVEVQDRSAATLEPLIEQFVLPGTHIVTDGWRAYRHISRLQGGVYHHSMVIHQENFVDPDDPDIHTQNIENMWMRAKRKLKWQFGTSDALFASYLDEFVVRSLWPPEAMFNHFLICLATNYGILQP